MSEIVLHSWRHNGVQYVCLCSVSQPISCRYTQTATKTRQREPKKKVYHFACWHATQIRLQMYSITELNNGTPHFNQYCVAVQSRSRRAISFQLYQLSLVRRRSPLTHIAIVRFLCTCLAQLFHCGGHFYEELQFCQSQKINDNKK